MAKLVSVGAVFVLVACVLQASVTVAARVDQMAAVMEPAAGTVVVDLFVMSRCPDALHCETVLGEVFQRVQRFTTIQLNYVANITADGQVTCKHGEQECAGDKQQLCVAQYTPRYRNFRKFYEFVMCQDANFSDIGSPELFHSCLEKVQFNRQTETKIRQCAVSKEGEELLAGSVAATKERGVSRSCTIHINGAPRCVRDGGRWYDCPGGSKTNDFVASVCDEYLKSTGKWPHQCDAIWRG